MKNIHILPTDKPSNLCIDNSCGELNYFTPKGVSTKHTTCQNIYITSDEYIRDVRPYVGKWHLEQGYILNKFPTYLTDLSECKLVIMTTDQDLIDDGVQAIDDEFLEWFVKNPSCEEVGEYLIGKRISVPDPRGGGRLVGVCTYAGKALTPGQFQVTLDRMPIWPVDPKKIIILDK